MTEAAEEIGSGPLDKRLGDNGSTDEVGELARTFDAMLDRLATAMTAQRRLLADVSHQLRTPLTVVRGHLEVLNRSDDRDPASIQDTYELVMDELDHMAVLVERLLMLGRAMEPDLLTSVSADLSELIEGAVESFAVVADRQFVVSPMPEMRMMVDREQLRGAIVNLLENAVHATRDGEVISVEAKLDQGTKEIRVVVEDSGPGIPAAQREAALQRFARPGARDADGSGLGLAIVKAVALAHGGSISIDQSPALGGARVAIVMPPERLVGAEA
jgi:signal transduction histidine kinase